MESLHCWVDEYFSRSGITIAASLELGCTLHVEVELVVGIRTEIAVLIHNAHCVEREVRSVDSVAVGIDSRSIEF